MPETGDVPILFSLPQMKNLGMTIELDPKREKITCPAFDLYPWNIPQWDILLDLTSLAYQPKSRERSARPTKPVTFEEKDLQSGEIHLPHWKKMRQEPRVSEQKRSRIWASNSDGEALHNIINKLSDLHNLKDLHLEHYHSLLHSTRREQHTWTFLERFMTFTSMW